MSSSAYGRGVLSETVSGFHAFRNISARIYSLTALPKSLRHLRRAAGMDPVLLGHLGVKPLVLTLSPFPDSKKKPTSVHVSKQFTFLPLPALPYVSVSTLQNERLTCQAPSLAHRALGWISCGGAPHQRDGLKKIDSVVTLPPSPRVRLNFGLFRISVFSQHSNSYEPFAKEMVVAVVIQTSPLIRKEEKRVTVKREGGMAGRNDKQDGDEDVIVFPCDMYYYRQLTVPAFSVHNKKTSEMSFCVYHEGQAKKSLNEDQNLIFTWILRPTVHITVESWPPSHSIECGPCIMPVDLIYSMPTLEERDLMRCCGLNFGVAQWLEHLVRRTKDPAGLDKVCALRASSQLMSGMQILAALCYEGGLEERELKQNIRHEIRVISRTNCVELLDMSSGDVRPARYHKDVSSNMNCVFDKHHKPPRMCGRHGTATQQRTAHGKGKHLNPWREVKILTLPTPGTEARTNRTEEAHRDKAVDSAHKSDFQL
ncbi:hypothetical protein ANN_24299 [Periplaneta americana]|uniref:Uncharacterized protein n=1 Tax=Periplaneta americana TaxID=6978 RepID=A0ABQ8S315_PERAM|nr:hypothetical protein ANN_24299 [Periplaneta americana]